MAVLNNYYKNSVHHIYYMKLIMVIVVTSYPSTDFSEISESKKSAIVLQRILLLTTKYIYSF